VTAGATETLDALVSEMSIVELKYSAVVDEDIEGKDDDLI
jgi:hypothetical protein